SLALLMVSCVSVRDYSKMTAAEKATEQTRLQSLAEDYFEDWNESDQTDLDALDGYIAAKKKSTELFPFPGLCPLCYRDYARGHRIKGIFYFAQRRIVRDRIRNAPDSMLPKLQRDEAMFTEKIREHFEASNRALASYFSTRENILPETYHWASAQHAELGNYRQALNYLKLLQALPLSERDLKEVESQRRRYAKKLRELELGNINGTIGG
ncbi:MAG: hypothetical protein AAF517_08320, partial [Planctomycetota bacterium]